MTDYPAEPTTDDAVRAGVAAHNVGEYGLARGIWAGETPLAGDDDQSPLRSGLAAFATAVFDGRRGNWDAALAVAEEARLALADAEPGSVQPDGVDLAPVRRWLAAFEADPEFAERSPPPTLIVDGDRPTPGELPLSAASLVATAVATGIGDDAEVLLDAVRFAEAHDRPETTRYATFIRDYAGAETGQRGIVFQRLSALVERERRKEDDVSGLFG